MKKIHIITRCTKTKNLPKLKSSIFKSILDFDIQWHIAFDTSVLKEISFDTLSELDDYRISLYHLKGITGDYGHNNINLLLDKIDSGWVYILDDDNILHENFFEEAFHFIENGSEGFIFSQFVGGKDFTGLEIRESFPDNVKVTKIDMAQFLLKRELIGNHRLRLNEYKADGYFIEEIYSENKDKFHFIPKVLCYYNYLSEPNRFFLPRVLVYGSDDDIILKSNSIPYESSELLVKSNLDDFSLEKDLIEFDPDCILSIGENYLKFERLSKSPAHFRKRWIHETSINENSGNLSYNCSMNYILDAKEELVSIFTPIYNIGDKLRRTYESLKNQTYNNWEWVIVNDSSDEGKTLKVAEDIASNDYRVKVYDFRSKSKGIVGESKYRAAVLCNGKYIMELDHDDYLVDTAISIMISAFETYPDSGFVYSDCAEVDEFYNSLNYGDGFAFGYGSYYNSFFNGMNFSVATSPNINPKTIRHIVGVPNHFRAWRKDFYLSIGGHNRRLSIADDYELIVRSFLKTRFVKIPKMLYIQFYHQSNTQNLTRPDIQRRVRSISGFYNDKIKSRFVELGEVDWAYDGLHVESKFGKDEGYVNYIFTQI